MQLVKVTAKEYNSIYPESMEDVAIFAVDETKLDPNNIVPLLRETIKKRYNVSDFGEDDDGDCCGYSSGGEAVWFGREMVSLDSSVLNYKEHGIELMNVIDIRCDWDNGEPY